MHMKEHEKYYDSLQMLRRNSISLVSLTVVSIAIWAETIHKILILVIVLLFVSVEGWSSCDKIGSDQLSSSGVCLSYLYKTKRNIAPAP